MYATGHDHFAQLFASPKKAKQYDQDVSDSWPVFSLTEPPPNIEDLKTFKHQYYTFTIDIMGLRDLSQTEDISQNDLRLQMLSFWSEDQPVTLHVPGSEYPGPNIIRPAITAKGLASNAVGLGAARMIMRQHEEQASAAFADTWNASGNRVGCPIGVRIRSPVFMTPLLPYLQYDVAEKLKEEFHEDLNKSEWDNKGLATSQSLQVILPDITLKLVDEGDDVATNSISLQDYRRLPEGPATAHLRMKYPRLAKVTQFSLRTDEDKMNSLPRLEVSSASITTVYIDSFAAHSGYLSYDDDLQPGRTLTDHDLFHIETKRGGEYVHLFNCDDYFIGWKERQHSPFIQPPMRATNLEYPGPTSDEYKVMREILFSKRFKKVSRGGKGGCCACACKCRAPPGCDCCASACSCCCVKNGKEPPPRWGLLLT
eukprot:GHVO01010455.1.p1 GENE.GHVO01010455.1~~GHVO01010455.1.p1  ORF type:complete len:481 (+),score=94.53 GHVO01010455.1:166-1443(+)